MRRNFFEAEELLLIRGGLTMKSKYSLKAFLGVVLGLGLFFGVAGSGLTPALAHDEEPPPAPGTTWEPETCTDDSKCGELSPLIPMTYNAVGSGFIWSSSDWETPKILYKGRHSEFLPTDVATEECYEQLVLNSVIPGSNTTYSAWPIPRSEWGAQFPSNAVEPNNIFFDSEDVVRTDPVGNTHSTQSNNPCLRSSFKHLVYGGYRLRQGQTQFIQNRIRAYWGLENAQVWDLGHPDAFKTRDPEDSPTGEGIFDNALIDEEDALLNIASFSNAGFSKGLKYNVYSLGYATLTDGKVVHIGGHNMQSNSGFRKMNIYDPETGTWANRPEPCQNANWRMNKSNIINKYLTFADNFVEAQTGQDGTGLGDRLVNPPIGAPTWKDCSQRIREDTDPSHPSDMRTGVWYPSGWTLPNGWAIRVAGDDEDQSVGPDETISNRNQRDQDFRNTLVFPAVADVYDPVTDTGFALENARRTFPLYPPGTVVQTGPGVDDWKLCVLSGEPAPVNFPSGDPNYPGSQVSMPRSDATDPAAEWRNFCATPGCANDTRAIRRRVDPNRASSLDCLNVQAAMADPNRNIPAENHWTHIDTAQNGYGYCCGTGDFVELDENGNTKSHKWFVIDGNVAGSGTRTADIEGIDFTDENPEFKVVAQTYQAGRFVHGVMLPDGTLAIRGGAGPGGGTYELRNYTKWAIFNPKNNSYKTLAKTTHAGSIHLTVNLMPDGTVITMAGDRASMVRLGDRTYEPGDVDMGVSVAQIFSPPYLFADADGTPAPRPVIETGPDFTEYGETFQVMVDLGAEVPGQREIDSVSIIRTGSRTHTLHNDDRYVKLPFTTQSGPNADMLTVRAPSLPAQAIAGDYMLFVVNKKGTPSVAKHVRLLLDDDNG